MEWAPRGTALTMLGGPIVTAILALGGAFAAPQAPDEAAPIQARVPDASWNAMMDHDVVVVRNDGSAFAGRLVGVAAEEIVLALHEDGRAVTVPKTRVAELRAAGFDPAPTPPPQPIVAVPRTPARDPAMGPEEELAPILSEESPDERDRVRPRLQPVDRWGIGLLGSGVALLSPGVPLWIVGAKQESKAARVHNASCESYWTPDDSYVTYCDDATYRDAHAKANRLRRAGIALTFIGFGAIASGSIAAIVGKVRRSRLERHTLQATGGRHQVSVRWSFRF